MMLYSCFDFRFSSEIPLGELTPAASSDTREIVAIRRGTVPDALPGAKEPQLGVQSAGGEALLSVPTVGRYWVRHGRDVVVDSWREAGAPFRPRGGAAGLGGRVGGGVARAWGSGLGAAHRWAPSDVERRRAAGTDHGSGARSG